MLEEVIRTESKGTPKERGPIKVGVPGRWRRYNARYLDGLFVWAFVYVCASLNVIPALPSHDPVNYLLLSMFYSVVFSIALEYICLKLFWTTPGKRILGMQIAPRNSNYSEALLFSRCWRVWFFGQGMGLPFISLLTQAKAGNRIKKTGEASWDADCGTMVVFVSDASQATS